MAEYIDAVAYLFGWNRRKAREYVNMTNNKTLALLRREYEDEIKREKEDATWIQ